MPRSQFALTFKTSSSSAVDATTYTYSSLDVGGTPHLADTRHIVVAVGGVTAAIPRTLSVTIGGAAATEICVTDSASGRPSGIFYVQDNSSTSVDVVVTFSGTMSSCTIGVWTVLNPADPGGYDNKAITGVTSPVTGLALNVPDGGAFLALCANNNTGGAWTWSGATERFDTATESSRQVSGADGTATGSPITLSASCAGGVSCSGVSASWAARG